MLAAFALITRADILSLSMAVSVNISLVLFLTPHCPLLPNCIVSKCHYLDAL